MRKIAIIGGSGLVGRAVCDRGNRPLHLFLRRPLDFGAAPVIGHIQHVADPTEWPAQIAAIAPDVLICTLGTTIKNAGSAAAFRAVDHDLVVACARAAKAAGAQQMIIVSSVGASAAASGLYLKTKGEMEDAVKSMGFARIDAIRPGLLIGDRSESRPGEALAQLVAPLTDALLHGSLRRFRSIPFAAVAQAISALSDAAAPGVFLHHHDEIVYLAK